MRILTDEEDGVSPFVSEDFQEAYEESILKPICIAQYHETCKEIGEMLLDKWDELSEHDFIVWMNGVIEELVRGEIPESEMPARLIKDASEVTGIWDGFDM